MFANLVSTFVPQSEGSFLIFLWHLGGFAGQRFGAQQMVIRAVPVKRRRCTNKTDDREQGCLSPSAGLFDSRRGSGARPTEVTYIHTARIFTAAFIYFFIIVLILL